MFVSGEGISEGVFRNTGDPVNCLLDTGSEVTLIPGSMVQDLPKKPVTSQIRAANGTIIEVLALVSLAVERSC